MTHIENNFCLLIMAKKSFIKKLEKNKIKNIKLIETIIYRSKKYIISQILIKNYIYI